MTITASMVKELREKTGVPMMECKKALQESNADVDKAILWLRERGLSRAAKKSGRATAEGMVQVMTSDDHSKAILLEINLSLIHISEPTRPERISYAVFCLKKKK